MADNTFHVRLLTGLASGGARRNGPPDREGLRPSSLRGGMRYWYRALAGSCFPAGYASTDAEVKAIGELESSLFGSTDQVARFSVESSPVGSLAVGPVNRKPGVRLRNGLLPSPHGDPDFCVRFRFRAGTSSGQQNAILGAWRVFCLLSGDGQRKRRGLGSLALLEQAPDSGLEQDLSLAQPAKHCESSIQSARMAINQLLQQPGSGQPTRGDVPPALSPQAAKVWLVAPTRGDGSADSCWQWFYNTVYTTYKAHFGGQLGARYGDRNGGALPSPLLFSIKEWPVGGVAARAHVVLVAWCHRAYASKRPLSYFADPAGPPGNEWGKLEAHLTARKAAGSAEVEEVSLT